MSLPGVSSPPPTQTSAPPPKVDTGGGLKQQWGVGAPSKPASDKQAKQFQAAFQPLITCINGHLQYTSANAEAAKHDPLEKRRDALYTAYQTALAAIDPTDESKAKGQIANVLTEAKALNTESAALKAAAEKALADWKARQPKFDAAVHQVEELEAWGDPKASPLRTLVDGIRTNTNERRYAPASTTVDQLLPKLKPIYDNYLKQKEAKPKYEQMHAEQSARLTALKALEKPSKPMTEKATAADTALQATQTKAEAKDYTGGVDGMKAAKTAIDELDKMAKDPQRAKFLADRKAVEDLVNAPADTHFKTLEADWNAILQLREQSDPPADAGDYAGANKILADLKTKVTAYKAKVEELKKAQAAYKAVADRVETQMQEANTVAYPALESKKAALTADYKKMTDLATAEDFKGALAAGTSLEASIKSFLAEREKQRTQVKANIKANLPQVENDMKSLASATSPIKDKINGLIASIKTAAGGNDDAALAKAAKDLDSLPGLVSNLKQVEEVKGKLGAGKDDAEKKKAAQDYVKEQATKGKLADMPAEARNLLIEQMMKGGASDKDTAAINKIWANPQLDPDFDSLDKPVRDKIIKAYGDDPKVNEYRKNWATMTADQKKDAIKYMTSIPCGKDGWNVGDPKNFEFFDTPKAADGNILYGSYNKDSDKMTVNLNNDAHGRFDELLDTLAHEIGHKQQGVLIDQFRNGTLKPGDANYEEAKSLSLCDQYRRNNYPQFKKVYSTSPEEAHSRVMGSELQTAMGKKYPPATSPASGGGTPGGGTSPGGSTAPTGPPGGAHKDKWDPDNDPD